MNPITTTKPRYFGLPEGFPHHRLRTFLRQPGERRGEDAEGYLNESDDDSDGANLVEERRAEAAEGYVNESDGATLANPESTRGARRGGERPFIEHGDYNPVTPITRGARRSPYPLYCDIHCTHACECTKRRKERDEIPIPLSSNRLSYSMPGSFTMTKMFHSAMEHALKSVNQKIGFAGIPIKVLYPKQTSQEDEDSKESDSPQQEEPINLISAEELHEFLIKDKREKLQEDAKTLAKLLPKRVYTQCPMKPKRYYGTVNKELDPQLSQEKMRYELAAHKFEEAITAMEKKKSDLEREFKQEVLVMREEMTECWNKSIERLEREWNSLVETLDNSIGNNANEADMRFHMTQKKKTK